MKKWTKWFVGGVSILLVVGAYLGRHSARISDEASGLAPVCVATEVEESDPTTPDSCSSCIIEGAGSESNRMVLVSLEDIPNGPLRDGLLGLDDPIQKEALRNLSQIGFQPSDANSMRVDPLGGIYFVCTFTDEGATAENAIAAADEGDAENAPSIEGASVPIANPPIRHSRPGASKVLFLDFNGHVVANTRWNINPTYGSIASWDCRPYDIDSNETTFSNTEQANIIQIWERVAEDYAPFDVDVTTEQPEAWTATTAHALITPVTDKSGQRCPHYSYGGVAYVNAFGDYDFSYNYSGNCYSPAWVTDMAMADIAEAASHELGHNLGLSHDGTQMGGAEYYAGHTTPPISWGPIMGTGYSRNISQWSKGEYYDSNRSQDDLLIIKNLLGYRPDDYGDNKTTASSLSVSTDGSVDQGGVVETTDDPDVFSFSTGAGQITINANSYRAATSTWGGNLDISLELYNESGTLVASSNPEAEARASVSLMVVSGTYYLHVKPTGVGSPTVNPPSGYTSYGSLGQYWLSGTIANDMDSDGIPNNWEQQYFASPTWAVATADSDGDGSDNYAEFVAGTHPTNPASVFKISAHKASAGGTPFIINWTTVPGRVYTVGYTYNLVYVPFTNNILAANLPYTVNSYTDTVQRAEQQIFYRVDVKPGQ